MIKTSRIMVLFLMLIAFPGVVWSDDDQNSRETLKGITGVEILVEPLIPELERSGLTRAQIITDVELKLRLAGIKVLTQQEALNSPGSPYLHINLFALFLESNSHFIYASEIAFRQVVILSRNAMLKNVAPTWRITQIGISNDPNDLRQSVKDRVDMFLNAWLSVNPK